MCDRPECIKPARDSAHYDFLFDTYASSLFAIIQQLTNDTRTAEEILKKSLVQICMNVSTFKPDEAGLFIRMLRITVKQCKVSLCLTNIVLLDKLKHALKKAYNSA